MVDMTKGKRLIQKMQKYADVFDGAAHPIRLSILTLIARKPMREKDLVKLIKIKQNLLSHHLGMLHAVGWVKVVRRGSFLEYSISPKAFKNIQRFLQESTISKFV